VLAISSKIKSDFFSLEKLIFLAVISFPMIIFLLLSMEAYLTIAVLLGILLLILIVHNYRYGLYFVVLGLPLFQSLTLKSDAATSTGINLQYVIIIPIFLAWLSEKISKKELSSIKLPFLALFSYLIIALAVSIINQMDTVSPGFIRQGIIHVYALANYLLLFYIIVNEQFDSQEIQKLLWGLLIIAFITAVIGIFQYISGYTSAAGGLRATSTFTAFLRTNTKNNPNAFGTYLAFMIVVALLVWNSSDKKHRILIGIIAIALFTSLLLSLSRSALLALIFSVLFYIWYQNRRAFLFAIFFVITMMVLLYFEPVFHRRIESIVKVVTDKQIINMFLNINPNSLNWGYVEHSGIEGYHSDIISGAFRIWAWIQAIHLFVANPFLGIGYHMTLAHSPWPTAENLYLDFASMTGLFGFILFMIIQIIFLKDGFQMLNSSKLRNYGMFWLNILIVIFITSLTGSILFHSKVMGIFWSIAGLIYNVKLKENNFFH
jgi:O-antigen ligase